MGNAASRGGYVPPLHDSTEDRRYRPPPHHVGRRLFGRDDDLTAAAVRGPPDMGRVVVDFLYLESIDAQTLISAFAVDVVQLGAHPRPAVSVPSASRKSR